MNKKATINVFFKFIISIFIVLFAIVLNCNKVEALTPTEDQYFELRATEINDIPLMGKQVIMELWGYNIDFSRTASKV